MGGTFVGGTSQGWSITDPNVTAAAFGVAPTATQAVQPTLPQAQPVISQPALGAATLPVYGGGETFSSAGGYPSSVYGIGGGTVGGSWSPEPVGNNQILYGHYSSRGGLTIPQGAATGAGAVPLASTQAMATGGATRAGGAAAPAPAAADAAAAKRAADAKAAAARKPAATAKPAEAGAAGAPGTVTVKPGDSLSKIAAANGMEWKQLYELNRAQVGSNPNLIKPGQVLRLK